MPRKEALTNLFIVRKDGTTGTYPSNHNRNSAKGIAKLKNILTGKEKGNWEVAYLYDNTTTNGGNPISSFHYTCDTEELDKVTVEELRRQHNGYKLLRAWCIPNVLSQVLKSAEPYPIYVTSKEEAINEKRRKNLSKVFVYDQEDKLIHKIIG